jgi:DNA-binding transcriptional MerR regulator
VASYGIGEVEALLSLPASTLRHWEKTLPLLSPRKDDFGRRVYSEADILLLLRLKHLAFDRGLGIKAAGEALLAELSAPGGELHARLAEIRGELVGLWFESLESSRHLEKASQAHNTGGST